MEKAIVLIQVEKGTANAVRAAMEKINNVEWAHRVTGPYDVIVYADLPTRKDFRKFVDVIHDVDGVIRTETCVGV